MQYQATLANGQHAVALINTNTSAAESVPFGAPLNGTLNTWSYSAGEQNATNSNIVTGTTTAAAARAGVTLPAESMLILKTQ